MTMITPSYLGETIEYSSLHACRSTLEDPTRCARDKVTIFCRPSHSCRLTFSPGRFFGYSLVTLL